MSGFDRIKISNSFYGEVARLKAWFYSVVLRSRISSPNYNPHNEKVRYSPHLKATATYNIRSINEPLYI